MIAKLIAFRIPLHRMYDGSAQSINASDEAAYASSRIKLLASWM